MKTKYNKDKTDQAVLIENLNAQDADASKVKGGIKLDECLITSFQTSSHGADL